MLWGNLIDLFDGEICRFNDFVLKEYSEYVGTRCDCWCGNNKYFAMRKYNIYNRVFLGYKKPKDIMLERTRSRYIGDDVLDKAKKAIKFDKPGGGILGIFYFLENGYDVNILGFDCCRDKLMHYYDYEETNLKSYARRLDWHDRDKEKIWIDKAINTGIIKDFEYI